MYKKDVIKYIKIRRRKSNEKNNAQLQETFKQKHNAGSYVLPDLGIGIFTNSVQVKAANSLKIGNIQAYGGSQVAFEATFKMNGYQKIEIYRSTSGGAFQLVDNFTEEGVMEYLQ